MWDTAVQVAAILWGNRLIYFYLFTACACESCCLAGLGLCSAQGWALCAQSCSPPSYTTALEVTLKILISGYVYGGWKRIWVRLKQLIISSFAVDNTWINFRLNWGVQLIHSRLRRGWWDVLTSAVLAKGLALGTGAAEVVVCSSFTRVTESSVRQSSSAQHCSASDHACPCLIRAESDCDLTPFLLTRAWHPLCKQHLLLEGREDNLFCKSSVGMLKRSWMGEKRLLRIVEGAWRQAQDGGRSEGSLRS